jgi:transposase
MRLFLRDFCKILEKEDRHFRTNTMIFWDGASYHHAKETRLTVKALKLPIMFLAPYSYLTAPCELAFGMFKNKNLNPEGKPLGKRSKYPRSFLIF